MAMFYGKITEFDKISEDWVSYVERMTLFFEANGIEEETNKDYFAIECWSTDVQVTKRLISAKQIGR